MGEVLTFPSRDRGETPHEEASEPLWREAVGDVLRTERASQARTLADVARTAGVSMPYLSEVERGLKEPSSEILQAVAGALGLALLDLATRVARDLAPASPSGPVALAA